MARPQKQTVDYFPHDASASEGDTLTILQSRFGNDGYAFWFKLLEKISSSENHIIDCRNSIKWQLLLAKTSTNQEQGLAIMDLLCELEAIDAQLWRESKIIWCQKLVDNIADVYKNRNRPVPERPHPTTNNLISKNEILVSNTDNPQSKVKKTKLKERKGEESLSPQKQELEFNEFIEELKPQYPDLNFDNELQKFHLYWSEGGRKLERPKLALKNWMDKAREFKQEGKSGTHRQGSRGLKPRQTYKSPDEHRIAGGS